MVSVMLYPLFYVCSVNVTVCIVCCLFDRVCEFGCGCYYAVKCYGSV